MKGDVNFFNVLADIIPILCNYNIPLLHLSAEFLAISAFDPYSSSKIWSVKCIIAHFELFEFYDWCFQWCPQDMVKEKSWWPLWWHNCSLAGGLFLTHRKARLSIFFTITSGQPWLFSSCTQFKFCSPVSILLVPLNHFFYWLCAFIFLGGTQFSVHWLTIYFAQIVPTFVVRISWYLFIHSW